MVKREQGKERPFLPLLPSIDCSAVFSGEDHLVGQPLDELFEVLAGAAEE